MMAAAPPALQYYFDSSALVKRYLVEPGTAWVEQICDPATDNSILMAQIGLLEVAAAFASKQRGGFIDPAAHETLLADLMADAHQQYALIEVN